MIIKFCDINPRFIDEARLVQLGFNEEFELSYSNCSFKVVEADAVVSPANSFGFMDGGFDAALTDFFGPKLQEDVQVAIKTLPFSELLVGQAMGFPTNNARIPSCIVAPTMRVPKVIYDPMDVFLATRAAVKFAIDAGFDSIILPGMGTGCGQLSLKAAAMVMHTGILRAFSPMPFPSSWREAQRSHFNLLG